MASKASPKRPCGTKEGPQAATAKSQQGATNQSVDQNNSPGFNSRLPKGRRLVEDVRTAAMPPNGDATSRGRNDMADR